MRWWSDYGKDKGGRTDLGTEVLDQERVTVLDAILADRLRTVIEHFFIFCSHAQPVEADLPCVASAVRSHVPKANYRYTFVRAESAFLS
jgi:hypothetical protein